VGQVPHEDLGEWLATAKVYVQFSRHESFGCAVADAMLYECIPVVSAVYGLPEVVGDCGIMVKGYDLEELREAVSRALEKSTAEGERCREQIEREFPLSVRAEELRKIVEEIAN
jgi:glycosyltransferase involved in cell wall biosynthesis